MSFAQEFLPELDQEMRGTRRVLERVPDAKLEWKPHPRSMSLGRLATHIAEIPTWADSITKQDSFDIAPPGGPAHTAPRHAGREEILGRFDDHVRAARAMILEVPEADWKKPWTLLKGGSTVWTMLRVAVLRAMILNHIIHHRAQLGVYLRLNDIPVPRLYGPTADESM